MSRTPPALPPDPRAATLHAMLRDAGEAVLAKVDLAATRKADGSIVTDADLAAEAVIIEALQRAFPGEAIVSEEAGGTPPSAGAVWFVDPVDGTSAMVEGLAHWGPTVCRVVDGRLDIGALYLPRLNEFWFAADGGGAWRGATRLRPAEPAAQPHDPTLYVPSGSHRVGPMPWHGKTRALGSTAAHLALVAAGGGAAAVVARYEPWDVGCGVLLVREAGRRVVDLSGADLDPMVAGAPPFLAAAHTILPAVREAVNAVMERIRRP